MKNNQLLSELTHAHYREPVPLSKLVERKKFGLICFPKIRRGVSGVSWQTHVFYIGHSQYGQLIGGQNRIATDQYHIAISRARVSTHQGDVIYLEAVR